MVTVKVLNVNEFTEETEGKDCTTSRTDVPLQIWGVGETLNSVTVCETGPQFCLQLKSVVLG